MVTICLILTVVSLAGLGVVTVYLTRLARKASIEAIHRHIKNDREFITFEVKS